MLSLELRVNVSKADGTPLDDDDHVFSNALNNTMFKSCACYFNEQLVESSSLFNYHAFIKMITTILQDKIEAIGRVAFYHRDYDGSKGIINKFDKDYFTGGNKDDKQMIKDYKTHKLLMTAFVFGYIKSGRLPT